MKLLLISIVEVIYVYYILNYFKTKYSIHHPLEYIVINKLPEFFKHPMGVYEYNNKICPFGHFASNLLVLYLLIRYLILTRTTYKLKNINLTIIIITAVLSLLNMNAFIYLIPFFILEFYVHKYIILR
jgi:hypothetical protein